MQPGATPPMTNLENTPSSPATSSNPAQIIPTLAPYAVLSRLDTFNIIVSPVLVVLAVAIVAIWLMG